MSIVVELGGEATVRKGLSSVVSIPGMGEIANRGMPRSQGKVSFSGDHFGYRPALMFRLPGLRHAWGAGRSDLIGAEVVERLPITGSKPRPRVRVRRKAGSELIFYPRNGDVEGVAKAVSEWISTGRAVYESKGEADVSGPFRSVAKRRALVGVLLLVMLAFPVIGFLLGYFVFSSHALSAGFVGLAVGLVLYFIVTQLISGIGHVMLGRRQNSPTGRRE